jgi:predicted transcriptional regulator of viral defense system
LESTNPVHFSSMKAAEIDGALGEISAGQWGMLTAPQARARGINRSNLAHREADGRLERLTHGVYRQGGAPSLPLDDLRAAWLSTNPEQLAYERTAEPDVVIGSAAAALVHEIGDIDPLPYRLITRGRRQTQRREIAYSQRSLDAQDVTVRDGLPVTTVERTIADLLRDYGDISLVADALRDATHLDRALDESRLAHLLAPLAQRYGHPEGNGRALLDQLLMAAELDVTSQVLQALQNPVLMTNLQQMLAAATQEAMKPLIESIMKNMPPATVPPSLLEAARNAMQNLPTIDVARVTALRADLASQYQATNLDSMPTAGFNDAIQRLLEPTRKILTEINLSLLDGVGTDSTPLAAIPPPIEVAAGPDIEERSQSSE